MVFHLLTAIETEIVEQFNQLQIHDVRQMWVKDELTGMNCIQYS